MSRYRVNPILCQGYGMCAEVAPAIYDLDDWGYAQSVAAELEGEDETAAKAGSDVCPVKAIRRIPTS